MPTVTKEKIGLLNEKITVTVNSEDYMPSFEKSIKQYAKNANIPGFRKGMVPVGMVRKMHGPAVFTDEVLRSIEKGLVDYLQNEKLEIFAQPLPSDENRADHINMNQPGNYSFSFEIGLKPSFDITLGNETLTTYKVQITDEMIQEEVDRMRQRLGKMTEPEFVESDEHVLNVLFEESDAQGTIIENGVRKENSLLVKYFSESFRPGLIGLKNDASVILQLTSAFDEKEREWLIKDLGVDANNPDQLNRHYKMTIKKVGLVEKRDLNEEFFKEAFPGIDIKTELEFRDTIKNEIQAQWDKQAQNFLHHELYHVMLEKTSIEFPENFLKKWMQKGGEKLKTAEEVESEFPGFKKQLKWTLISDKIAQENNLEVQPQEVRDNMKMQIMGYFGGMSMDSNLDWLDSYVDRMLKDEQQVESTYRRLITEKIFLWAEQQVQKKEQSIDTEGFMKLQEAHHHEH